MTNNLNGVRNVMLSVIAEQDRNAGTRGSLQSGSVLAETVQRLGFGRSLEEEQAILTTLHDLMRTGFVGWGLNLANPSPPFMHVTARGRGLIEKLSRDPGNPDGYIAHLRATSKLNDVAQSYVEESLNCYVGGFYRAATVLIGAAAESLILELRDQVVEALKRHKRSVPARLLSWQAKGILDEIHIFFDSQSKAMPAKLREEFSSYWAAFAQQIRATRNEAGHPMSIIPVTSEAVHASLLLFPELASLQNKLNIWVEEELK